MIRLPRRLALLLWLPLLLAPMLAPAAEAPLVRITTSMGSFLVELDPERAPLTVENFLTYVRAGHYDNTVFHRVIANFVVQGGGFDVNYAGKPTREKIPNESGNGLRNLRGTIAMARTAKPHSADSQFYVNVGNNADLDPLSTRWGYAVFGKVIEGLEVVDRISLQPTGAVGPFTTEAPLKPIVIESVRIISGDAGASAPAAEPPPEQ